MNSTGKNLTNTDLLRNYLLMALPFNKQVKLYKNYWAKIQKNVGAKLMEQYMVHYLIMKRKSDSINLKHRSSKINKNNLYDCYKLYPESVKLSSIIISSPLCHSHACLQGYETEKTMVISSLPVHERSLSSRLAWEYSVGRGQSGAKHIQTP